LEDYGIESEFKSESESKSESENEMKYGWDGINYNKEVKRLFDQ
jgi:hypothetical protein